MPARVIIPPDPIVTPADIAGATIGDDVVAALIQAATEEIDGPDGWLGRALGPQTLELALSQWPCGRVVSLPCRPIIEIEAVTYLDGDGAEQEVAADNYCRVLNTLRFAEAFSAPATLCADDAIRIRYRAGYDGTDADSGGTGAVPERAKQAIIIAVQELLRTASSDAGALRSETVDGVGTLSYLDRDKTAAVAHATCDRLLDGLKVWTV